MDKRSLFKMRVELGMHSTLFITGEVTSRVIMAPAILNLQFSIGTLQNGKQQSLWTTRYDSAIRECHDWAVGDHYHTYLLDNNKEYETNKYLLLLIAKVKDTAHVNWKTIYNFIYPNLWEIYLLTPSPNMSVASKATLALALSFSASVIVYVHVSQKKDREVGRDPLF